MVIFYWIVSNCKIIKMIFAFWHTLKGEGPAGVGGGPTLSQNDFAIQRTQSVRNFIIIRYCTTYHFFLLLLPLTNIKKIV